MITSPPVAAVIPDSSAALNNKLPPIPVSAVFTIGRIDNEFPWNKVVISGLLFPANLKTPFSSSVIFVVPFDCRVIRVLVAELVSLIKTALAVPWLVIKNFESLVAPARVKEISLLAPVEIVFPRSYADCKVEEEEPAEHLITLSFSSTQIEIPELIGRLAKVTVLEVDNVVVEIPVAPVIAPDPEILTEGELRKFVKPLPKEIAL